MPQPYLRKLKATDKKYFSRWWKDKELIKLTSGFLKLISDKEIKKYFLAMLNSKTDHNFMITLNRNTVGHLILAKRPKDWYETRIVIGEKQYWGKGYGPKAIKLLLKKAKHLRISKIYLEVRPENKRAIKAYEKSGFQIKRVKKYPYNKYLSEVIEMVFKRGT